MPQGDEKRAAIREMFDTIAPRYDMVNRIMTFRLDTRWRKRAVRDLRLPPGSVVLDLASGTGDLCIDLVNAELHDSIRSRQAHGATIEIEIRRSQ